MAEQVKAKASRWERFKHDPSPGAQVREIKEAWPDGPGLPAMYDEIKERGTLFGIPVLRQGRNIFVPRKRIVERVEGRE